MLQPMDSALKNPDVATPCCEHEDGVVSQDDLLLVEVLHFLRNSVLKIDIKFVYSFRLFQMR